jgi:hemin uptake protein HemP
MALTPSDPPHGDQGDRGAVSAAQPAAANDRSIPMNGNRFDSRDIFQTSREVIISHGDEVYRLRLTAQNKLILTK